MGIDEIDQVVRALDGVLVLEPAEGDGTPELAWGDRFYYYAPDGVVPQTQPFATIVTKDYPDEPSSGLDREGAFRVNVAAGAEVFAELVGRGPKDPAGPDEPAPDAVDVVLAHPVYGSLGWLAIVEPGAATSTRLHALLIGAHGLAKACWDRREDARG